MSALTREICFELGYHEGIDDIPYRGPPKLLLDDLESFAESRPLSESGGSLSAAYLTAKPAGLKHKLPESASQSARMLSWPRDQLLLVRT